jgi:hypothetical protein
MDLEPGTRFKFISPIQKNYRNLVLKTVSQSSATISGDHYDGESWKPIQVGYTITSIIEVDPDDTPIVDTPAKLNADGTKRRGRKPKLKSAIEIEFPKNKEFTLKDIATKFNVTPIDVNVALTKNKMISYRIIDSKDAKMKTKSGKGRKPKIYIIED